LTLRSMSDAKMASEKNKHLAGGLMVVRGGVAKQNKSLSEKLIINYKSS